MIELVWEFIIAYSYPPKTTLVSSCSLCSYLSFISMLFILKSWYCAKQNENILDTGSFCLLQTVRRNVKLSHVNMRPVVSKAFNLNGG